MGFNKERAIISQNSATAAAAIVSSLSPASASEAKQVFDDLRQHIFEGTLALASAETVVRAFESPTSVAVAFPAPTPAYEAFPEPSYAPAPQSSGFDPSGPAGLVLKFGKYKGRTVGDVWNDPTPDPKSGGLAGRGWLEWAAGNSSNDFMKAKLQEFLQSVSVNA